MAVGIIIGVVLTLTVVGAIYFKVMWDWYSHGGLG